MNVNDMIKSNNEKRKQLNDKNLKAYEDMLLYIRSMTLNKSEQQTEEVLMELLDHLLLAQAEGKVAQDVFGSDLKAYCQDIVKAIPKEEKKKSIFFLLYIFSIFGATFTLSKVVLDFILILFNINVWHMSLAIGKTAVVIVIALITVLVIIQFIVKSIANDLFESENRFVRDFVKVFLIGSLMSLPLIASVLFLPGFGMVLQIPIWFILILGIILLLASFYFKRKSQTIRPDKT